MVDCWLRARLQEIKRLRLSSDVQFRDFDVVRPRREEKRREERRLILVNF